MMVTEADEVDDDSEYNPWASFLEQFDGEVANATPQQMTAAITGLAELGLDPEAAMLRGRLQWEKRRELDAAPEPTVRGLILLLEAMGSPSGPSITALHKRLQVFVELVALVTRDVADLALPVDDWVTADPYAAADALEGMELLEERKFKAEQITALAPDVAAKLRALLDLL